jgi:Tripartite tricarboxylate transporter TctB family
VSRRTQENIVAGVFLAVFLALLYMTVGYSSRARLVPLPIAILGVCFAVAQLLWQNFRAADELNINALDLIVKRDTIANAPIDRRAVEEDEAQPQATDRWRSEPWTLGMVALLLALVLVVGPLPAILVFTGGYLAITRHSSLARSAFYAFACAVVLYGLFGYTLGVQLNRGLISGVLVDYVDF